MPTAVVNETDRHRIEAENYAESVREALNEFGDAVTKAFRVYERKVAPATKGACDYWTANIRPSGGVNYPMLCTPLTFGQALRLFYVSAFQRDISRSAEIASAYIDNLGRDKRLDVSGDGVTEPAGL